MIDFAPYATGILAAYFVLLTASLSPGPSVALLIGIATGQGRKPALAATLGIAFGSMSLNILTLLGVGLLLTQAAWAMTALRIVGALYLLYLAFGAFKRFSSPAALQPVSSDPRSLLKQFITGYLLQITNPKAVAFWLVIASIGAVENASFGVVVFYIAGAFLISFSAHGAWALILSVNTIRSAYLAERRWIEATLGCFFLFAAYKLATSEPA